MRINFVPILALLLPHFATAHESQQYEIDQLRAEVKELRDLLEKKSVVNNYSWKRTLTDPRTSSQKQQMLAELPKDKMIRVIGVLGDSESVTFANEIAEFLKQNGFKVDGPSQALYAPQPPRSLIRSNLPDGSVELIVGIQ